ncbi:MAG: DUF3450 domain-containing protein [Desulfobacterales bacterium]|nr:DUF3450 domain-containing protein [Desulfobacterales bacterium]
MDKSDNKKEEFLLPACSGKKEVPSQKEMEALDAMKAIKDRVRPMKKQLASLKSSGNDGNAGMISELQRELDSLKAEWNNWEEIRQKAAKERMIILGHEDGPSGPLSQ